MLESLVIGLLHVFEPANFLFLFIGVFSGIVFGALPGLTATMGLALLVPFTFTMSPTAGLIMLAGIYVGAMYGDAIPAILINTPGTPAAIATTFDGFPLSQKGMAQHGLVAAAFASSFGSLVANVVLATSAPPLAEASLKFGPPEYFWLGVFGLTIISTLSTGSVLKGFLAGALGLLLSTVGMAPIGGDVRLTFGSIQMQAGIQLIVALIGFFCLPEILSSVIGRRQAAYASEKVTPRLDVIWETIVSLIKKPFLLLRSAAIGCVVGFAPGAGGNIASMVSYNEACRWDSKPEDFGKGTIKGVAASEAANSAMAPGSLIPLLTLGIPGSPPAAVILGALMLHGMRPGAELFTTYADVIYAFIMALLVGTFLVTIIGSFGPFFFARIINVPSRFLAPTIIFMTVLGSYAIRNNTIDVWIMFLFGIVGYISNKLKFHPAPIVLGLILGPFVEEGLVQSMLAGKAAGGVLPYMVFRPISMVLIVASVLSLFWPVFAAWKAKRKKAACPGAPAEAAAQTASDEAAPKQSQLNSDILVGCAALVIAGIAWWATRDLSRLGGIFVQFTLVALAGFSVLTLLKGAFLPERITFFTSKAERNNVAAGVCILGAYLTILPLVGFMIASTLFFAVMHLYLGHERLSAARVGKSAALAVVVVAICSVVFKQVLEVPLPQGSLFGG